MNKGEWKEQRRGEKRKNFPFKKLQGIVPDPLHVPPTTLYHRQVLLTLRHIPNPLACPMHHHHPVRAQPPKWSRGFRSFHLKIRSLWSSRSDLLKLYCKPPSLPHQRFSPAPVRSMRSCPGASPDLTCHHSLPSMLIQPHRPFCS